MPRKFYGAPTMDGDPGEGGDEAEIRAVLNEIENNDDGNQTVILAVVAPKDKGPLEQIVKRKRREGSLQGEVIVTTKAQLQDQIEWSCSVPVRKLYLIASIKVRSIRFDIPDLVKQVFIYPCGKDFVKQEGALWILSDSTFCGIPFHRWISGNQVDLPWGHRITYAQGCTVDARILRNMTSDDLRTRRRSNDSDRRGAELMRMLDEVFGERGNGPSPTSDGAKAGPQQTQLQTFNGLVAEALRAGYNDDNASISVSLRNSGIYFQGYLGFGWLLRSAFNFP
ncbi:hypothetical protein VTJ04DRAFT_443 [Mycothermus thermophilus]|uniref:uncharacterized protein n=1 Tax=Humicola insolens TaxID=85995 RepID=UPI003742468D